MTNRRNLDVYRMKKNSKTDYLHILLYVAFAILMIFVLFSKTNLHVDEVYTYRLANSVCYSNLFEDGVRYEPAEQVFHDSLTANDSRRFDYENVWRYQEKDAHPPLYYALVHTVCSFFPGSFSIWYAGIINIVFALLTLFCARKLFLLLTENKLAQDLLSVAFILSAGVLSAISFLRMYIMAMFFVTWISYLITREIGKASRWKFYVSIFFSLLLASLTHYYCIAYFGFLSIVFVIYLVANRKWKAVGGYCGTVIAALTCASLIFPPMLRNVFFSNRGRETIWNLTSGTDPLERLVKFYGFINQQLFGNFLGYILLAAAFGFLYTRLCRREEKRNQTNHDLVEQICKEPESSESFHAVRFAMLIIPSLLYFLLVSKTAAYQTDRYVFPIYAVCFAWVLSLAFRLARKILDRKVLAAALCGILSLVTIGSLQNSQWPYLYQKTDALLEKASHYKDVDCICIYDTEWKTQPAQYEFSNYRSITFVKKDHLEQLTSSDLQSQKEIIVLLVGIENKEVILKQILDYSSSLDQYRRVGSYAYGSTFYLFEDKDLPDTEGITE